MEAVFPQCDWEGAGCCLGLHPDPDWHVRWSAEPSDPTFPVPAIRGHGQFMRIAAAEMRAAEYTFRAEVQSRGVLGPRQAALVVPSLRPPAFRLPEPPLQVTITGAAVVVSTAAAGWHPGRAGGGPLQYRFALQSPEGLLLPLPGAPATFTTHARVQIPRLPGTLPGPGEYRFALEVRDPRGGRAAVALAPVPPEAWAPSCHAVCASPALLWMAVTCGACHDPGQYQPYADLLRRVDAAPAAPTPEGALRLLRQTAWVARHFARAGTPGGLAPARAMHAVRLLVNATAPALAADDAVAVLLQIIHLLMDPDPALTVDLVGAVVRAAAAARHPCEFRGLHAHAAPLEAAVWRAPAARLPDTLRLPAGGASATLPKSLRDALAGALGLAVVDVAMVLAPAGRGFATAALALQVRDPATGAAVPIADLPDPVTLVFPGAAPATDAAAPAEALGCRFAREGVPEWLPHGVWLARDAAPDRLACRALHLTVFVVQEQPWVAGVRGCAVDVGQSSLHCPPLVPALTVTGGHFGPEGAEVRITAAAGAAAAPCAARHTPDREQEELTCAGVRLPYAPEPMWYRLVVRTRAGTTAALDKALLSTGYPVLEGLEVVGEGEGACLRAGPRSLVGCPVADAQFGLSGTFRHSSQFAPVKVRVGAHDCPTVAVVNGTYIECRGLSASGYDHPVTVTMGGTPSPVEGRLSFRPGLCRGWLSGVGCSACQSGYWGPDCTGLCPGVGAGLVCGGHGECSDNVRGSGRCECDRSPDTGVWDGAACDQCHAHYYGPRCRGRCPVGAPGVVGGALVCSGHGVCDRGTRGTGTCLCEPRYIGAACQTLCPASLCSGHGACEAGGVPGLGQCLCHGNATHGHWEGADCDACSRGWTGRACDLPCPVHTDRVCAGHGQCAVRQEEAVCVCAASHAGPVCEAECPRGPGGSHCSGHGVCRGGAGAGPACACAARWAGATCAACAEGHTGPLCAVLCRRNATGHVCGGHGTCEDPTGRCRCAGGHCGDACEAPPAVCAAHRCANGTYGVNCEGTCACAHGACLDGWFGSGACACYPGWTGPRCAVPCEGGTVPVCSGHGDCVAPTGHCRCQSGWRTGDGPGVCDAECPGGAALPCHGHGNCTGAAACECDWGWAGADCATPCARDASARVCGGHGVCDRLQGGCVCSRNAGSGHWAGAACDVCADGYYDERCAAACVSGYSVARRCVCETFWATPNCSVHCPHSARGVACGGHGVCDSGASGTGRCLCYTGYAGPACDVQCPSAGDAPCTGHGLCNSTDGACACHTTGAGYWAGAACDRCVAPYFGANCNLLCPKNATTGLDCSGHGRCIGAAVCTCDAGPAGGWWAGALCTHCAPGHFGADCAAVCPGGSCNPCAGHGRCREGLDGDGGCECARGPGVGYWATANCSECARGYWTPQCTEACPGGAARPCSGHGVCSDGTFGTGRCACAAGPATGWWAGPDCGVCVGGYFGPNCTQPCPGLTAGQPCHGHGRCAGGRTGDGECACDLGYLPPDCQFACPLFDGAVCGNIGRCVARATRAACDCTAAPEGQWGGAACEACAEGWTGARCTLPCPRDSADPGGPVCSGRGDCVVAADGRGTACTCRPGYAGTRCEWECAGGALNPCNGHGHCDAMTGNCTCLASNASGHWAGADCGVCETGWSGWQCRMACPRHPGTGAPCSGMRCAEGLCLCARGSCGDACHLIGLDCNVLSCPAGYFGLGCDLQCPRTARGTCDDHGTCLSSVLGNGQCICNAGYAGALCEVACAATPAGVCAGHGRCDAAAQGCLCDPWHATADCSVACPTSTSGAVCGAHGACDQGARGRGTCACDTGYAGAACHVLCPGYGAGQNASGICGGHGTCMSETGRCDCQRSGAEGHWAGAGCLVCARGWSGGRCTTPCRNGTTAGRDCLCFPGFATADCSVECPGPPGARCSGHGTCFEGHAGNGTCACRADWYGPGCGTFCRADLCFDGELYPAPHGECAPDTGACRCQSSRRTGYWAGDHCNECATGFWGVRCDQLCTCSGHGGCGWLDGDCRCFQDDVRGYWTGRYCDACSAGYLAPECLRPNVAVSRSLEIPVGSTQWDAAAPAAVVADEEHRLLYIGGMPLLVFDMDSGANLPGSTLDLQGTARAGWVTATRIYLLLQPPSAQGRLRTVAVSRGPQTRIISAGDLPAPEAAHRRRAFRPQQSPAPRAHAQTFVAHGAQHVVLFGDDGLRIVQQPLGAGAATTAGLSRQQLGLADVSATGLWYRGGRAEPSALLLAGTGPGGEWEVVALALPGPGSAAPVPLREAVAAQLPECDPCAAVAGLVLMGSDLYVALRRRDGVLVVVVDLGPWYARAPRVRHANLLPSTARTSVVGMVADPHVPAVLVVVHEPGAPSTVFKLRPDALLYGTLRFGMRGGQPEVIAALMPAVALRRLYALLDVQGQPVIVTLVLAAVVRLQPPLADEAGGTRILVHGEGFRNGSSCHFGPGLRSAATFVSPTLLQCEAPPSKAVAEVCAGDLLEVTLVNDVLTDNRVPLLRVATPTITRVVPPRGYFSRRQWVVLEGYGFVKAPGLACRFSDAHAAVVVQGGSVHVNSSTRMMCLQPQFNRSLATPSHVAVSVDGQVFDRSAAAYAVVGVPAALLAEPRTLTVRAAATVSLAELPRPPRVFTVDEQQQKLLRFDGERYVVSVTITPDPTGPCSGQPPALGPVQTERGVADLRNPLRCPAVGEYNVTFFSPALGARATMTLLVTEGAAHSLRIRQTPSDTTDNVLPLQQQPKLELQDAAGNQIRFPVSDAGQLVLVATVWENGGNTTAPPFEVAFANGVFDFKFAKIKVKARYGYEYSLKFALHSELQVPAVEFRPITATGCPPTHFYVRGDTTCRECVAGALCDGTARLRTQANHWRPHNRTHTFAECPTFRPDRACLAGFEVGTCGPSAEAPRFQGPLCGVCVAGYMGKECRTCGEISWQRTLSLLGGAYLLIVTWTTVRAFHQDANSKRLLTISTWKRTIGYLQTLGTIQPVFAEMPLLQKVFGRIAEVVSIAIPLDVLQCAVPSVTYYGIFWLYMAIPAVSLAIALLAWLYDRTLGCRPLRARRLNATQRRIVRSKLVTRNRRVVQIVVISTTVVLLFLYPTLNRRVMKMNQCHRFVTDAAPGGAAATAPAPPATMSLLQEDFTIDCADPGHKRMQALSLAFLGVYGVGIPAFTPVLGMLLRAAGGERMEMETFAFLFVGFKREFRYWECVNMARKLAMASVMTFVPEPRLRVCTAMWVLSGFLLLQLMYEPSSRAILNRMDTQALLMLIVNLNVYLLVLPKSPPVDKEGPVATVLELGILVLHGSVVAHFLLGYAYGFAEVAKHGRAIRSAVGHVAAYAHWKRSLLQRHTSQTSVHATRPPKYGPDLAGRQASTFTADDALSHWPVSPSSQLLSPHPVDGALRRFCRDSRRASGGAWGTAKGPAGAPRGGSLPDAPVPLASPRDVLVRLAQRRASPGPATPLQGHGGPIPPPVGLRDPHTPSLATYVVGDVHSCTTIVLTDPLPSSTPSSLCPRGPDAASSSASDPPVPSPGADPPASGSLLALPLAHVTQDTPSPSLWGSHEARQAAPRITEVGLPRAPPHAARYRSHSAPRPLPRPLPRDFHVPGAAQEPSDTPATGSPVNGLYAFTTLLPHNAPDRKKVMPLVEVVPGIGLATAPALGEAPARTDPISRVFCPRRPTPAPRMVSRSGRSSSAMRVPPAPADGAPPRRPRRARSATRLPKPCMW